MTIMKKRFLLLLVQFLLVLLLLPQLFVISYWFGFFFRGPEPVNLIKTVVVYGFSISRVSAPFIILITVLVRYALKFHVRWFILFPCCLASGYMWLAAWNGFVYPMFSYTRAIVPILLCSVGSTAYALALEIYQRDLPRVPKKESSASE